VSGGVPPDERSTDPLAGGHERAEDSDESTAPGPAWVRALGRFGIAFARHAGRSAILVAATVGALRHPRRYLHETFVQAKRMGVDSLGLVLLVAALSGAVLAQQTGYQFTTLPMWIVGEGVTSGMITELGPVLTAIILAGRVGAGMGAELGTMKVTDQIDALRTLNRDPVVELIVPRVLAGIIVMIPLVVLANAAGIFSGWITGITLLPMSTHQYVYGAKTIYHSAQLVLSLVKAVAFGFAVAFIGCYVGIQAEGGAAGVGRTTTNAVVSIIVAVMILDVLLAPIYRAVS